MPGVTCRSRNADRRWAGGCTITITTGPIPRVWGSSTGVPVIPSPVSTNLESSARRFHDLRATPLSLHSVFSLAV